MDLGGAWQVAAATEGRRRVFHELDYDDSAWVSAPVPGHWAEVGEDHDGANLAERESVLYRRRFDFSEPGPEAVEADGSADESGHDAARWWLRFEGIAEQSDVWMDGSYLGHSDGYFVAHEHEVTDQVTARSEHLLAVEATCARLGDPDNRSTLTGALQDPELCGAEDLLIGGIWRPVTLRRTGRIAIRHARVRCAEMRTLRRRAPGAAGPRARLKMRAVLDAPGGGPVELRTRVAGVEHVHGHHAADGENRVEWTVDVNDPPLWWPHALGDQPLFGLSLEAVDAASSQVHDRRGLRLGFRSVTMRRWVIHVNGERMFAKGANLLPARRLIGAASSLEVAEDVYTARDGGLDLLRPVAHVARPELYDAADESGMLIWQDLPVRGLMSRGVADEARRQAREAVDLLAHHPSVALWCAHDEPFARPKRPTPMPPAMSTPKPSWNRDVLDRRLARVLERCDGTRPVVSHTAVGPRLPLLEATTSQFWFGSQGARASDLAARLTRVPAMGRFVSAFGTSVSSEQPLAIKTTVETLRRLKYRPCGGFLLHALADVRAESAEGRDRSSAAAGLARALAAADGDPADVSESTADGYGVLDGVRRPKAGWRALVEACRPLIVTADPLPALVQGGERIVLAVHVVNDARREVPDALSQARVVGPDNAVISEHRWRGAVGADECRLIGRIDFKVPEGRAGALTLSLTLLAAGAAAPVLASNRYHTTVVSQ